MKNFLIVIIVFLSFSVMAQTAYENVRFNDNNGNAIDWQRVEIYRNEETLILNLFSSASSLPISHEYRILSGPRNFITGGKEYTVKRIVDKYATYTMVVTANNISFVNDRFTNIVFYYSCEGIGTVLL